MVMSMTACNLCGGTAWTVLEDATPTRVVRCVCDLVFVTPLPSRPVIESAYDARYYQEWRSQDDARRRMWAVRMQLVESYRAEKGTLLDIGCGDATFLRLARSHGWQTAGTELSPYASQASPDLAIHRGEVWEAGLPSGSFDVVTCWHVIEHVSDPLRLLLELFRLLRPHGRLFLATPNMQDYLFRIAYVMTRGRWPPLYEPDERELHLYYFNSTTLRALAEKAGFSEVTVGYDKGAAVTPAKRLVDRLAYWWYRATGLHWGMGLQLIARKPGAAQAAPTAQRASFS